MSSSKKKKKEVTKVVKLQVPAAKANPSPPVGPALGQAGVNIMEFCNAFNGATKEYDAGAPVPVTINVYKDRSFDFTMKKPPVSYYIKKVLNMKKGGSEPGKVVAGKITWDQLKEVAEIKMCDLNAYDVDSAAQMVRGSALSMGLEIVE